MEFAEAVKKVRTELGYSQEQLARALNISFSTINRWENGKVNPSQMAREVFMNFCKNKGISIDSDGKRGGKHD